MKRILMRSGKDPWTVVSPEATLSSDVIGANSGNFLFSYAAHRMLSRPDTEVVSRRLGFTVDDPGVTLGDPDRINAEYDHVVLPLANAFRPEYHEQLDIVTDLIERLTIPVTVLSVGAQTDLSGDMTSLSPLDDSVRRFARAVLDKSPTIGVRGEFTADYLAGLGIADVEVIGCPSVFLHGSRTRVDKTRESIDHDARVSFSVTPRVSEMGPVTMAHVERFENIRLIPQDRLSLRLMLWGNALPGFGPKDEMPFHSAHPLFRRDKARFFVDPKPWIDYMGTLDFAFGDRIHGNVAAILAGKPALLLAHDSRTLELARYHKIPYVLVSELEPGSDAIDYFERADYTEFNSGQAARWATFEAYLRKNGLEHAMDDPEQLAGYDARVAAAPLPGPVRAVSRDAFSPDLDRVDWLYRELGRSPGALSRLRASVAEDAARIAALEAQVAELTSLGETSVSGRLRSLRRSVRRSLRS